MAGTSDYGVDGTALDASLCKLSAHNQGYFQDPFVQYFCKKTTRRIPLIHRGYYLRERAIKTIVDDFLHQNSNSQPTQILSLGAGFDTLIFRLLAQKKAHNLQYYEIDCSAITKAKVDVITKTPDLQSLLELEEATKTSSELHSTVLPNNNQYHLMNCDLGDVSKLKELLMKNNFDPTRPTFVLSECVMVYMRPDKGSQLLSWLADELADVLLVMYEPFRLSDAYGQTMQKYFNAKGCELRSLSKYPDANSHQQRLLTARWKTLRLTDMNGVYLSLCDQEERQRLSQLEPFDEFQDWFLSNSHYCFTVASNCAQSTVPGLSLAVVDSWTNRTEPHLFAEVDTYLSSELDSSTGIQVRICEDRDIEIVREIFENSHLEFREKSKAVDKFVKKCLKTDLNDIERTYLQPTTQSGRRSCFWVAEIDGVVQGTIAVRPRTSDIECQEAELCRMGVLSSIRRLGIGTSLLRSLETFCRSIGYRKVVLETLGHMEQAQRFYAKHGFVLDSEETLGTAPNDFVLSKYSKCL